MKPARVQWGIKTSGAAGADTADGTLTGDRTAVSQTAARDQSQMMRLTDLAEVAARNTRLGVSPEAYVALWEWIYGYDVESTTAESEAQSQGGANSDERT